MDPSVFAQFTGQAPQVQLSGKPSPGPDFNPQAFRSMLGKTTGPQAQMQKQQALVAALRKQF